MPTLTFEKRYTNLVKEIYANGEDKECRNGFTRSIFGAFLDVGFVSEQEFPAIQGREMFFRGVAGELIAMLNRATTLKEFEDYGCNYWKKWAKPDGSLTIDYGHRWYDFEGVNQMDMVRDLLRNDPNSRRIIISGWHPANIGKLDLECCHFLYQFYVSQGDTLNLLWTQRSADMLIGIPSDIQFSALWLMLLANEVGMKPGSIKMSLGDSHVYHAHFGKIDQYLKQADSLESLALPNTEIVLDIEPGMPIEEFRQEHLSIKTYEHLSNIKFPLIA